MAKKQTAAAQWKKTFNSEDFDSSDDVEEKAKEIHKKAKQIFKELEGTSEFENGRVLYSHIGKCVEDISNENNSLEDDVRYLNEAQRCLERLELADDQSFEVKEEKKKK